MRRELRRYHYRRLQRKRKHYWFGKEIPMTPKQLGMVVSTPHPCSCLGCGNPRKHLNEKTVQERRNEQDGD